MQTPTRGANCVRARERERGLKRGLKRSALWWGNIRQGGGRNQRGKSGKERAPFTRGCKQVPAGKKIGTIGTKDHGP